MCLSYLDMSSVNIKMTLPKVFYVLIDSKCKGIVMENKEQPQNNFKDIEKFALASLGLLAISMCAFSKPVRNKIKARDGNKSVWSGKTTGLEAAHINHNKKSPKYNDVSNGRMLTTAEHFWDHVNRHGTKGLGLSDEANNWAIVMLWKRFWGIIK